ncbi:PIN domain-containing protein [Azospirillum sp. ST 5-10]|uniref:PIN domain-containing protein n=1 Tax=unclassified Azospirillum TaxID=2630922 RepID=UPI003F4A2764
MTRAALDTNVLSAGLRSRQGASFAVLSLLADGRRALVTTALFLEYEAAVNGRADVLVTHDVRDFATAAPRFGVPVLGPAEFLRGMAT